MEKAWDGVDQNCVALVQRKGLTAPHSSGAFLTHHNLKNGALKHILWFYFVCFECLRSSVPKAIF